MSQTLFNFITDCMLQEIPTGIGVKVSSLEVNVMAFADDMVMVASTPVGLQKLFDVTTKFLHACGLDVNAMKSHSVAIKSIPHVKKVAVDKDCVFTVRGREIPALKRSDQWVYLGVPLTPEGRIMSNIKDIVY